MILIYLAAILFLVAFAQHWQKTRSFLLLALGSILGFPAFVVVAASMDLLDKGAGMQHHLFSSLFAVAFIVAVVVCPAGFIVGAAGAITAKLRQSRRAESGVGRLDHSP